MYRYLLFTVISNLLLLITFDQSIAAENNASQEITRSDALPRLSGSQETFSGKADIQVVFPVTQGINASGAYVTFEPGARSFWHSHPRGQYIIVTEGSGLTQEWGKPVQEIFTGDVVWCPPGVKHWHGATPQAGMTHLVFTGEDESGNNVDWMESVSSTQYQSNSQ